MSRAALTQTFRQCDLVLSGGGSLLQDTTSLRSLIYYLWVVRLAQRYGAPVMFYAQGIGPLRRPSARRITRFVADRVARITVRDPESAALLRRIGVRKPPIEITADPAFALRPAPDAAVEEIIKEAGGRPGERYIGVALRPWHVGVNPLALSEITGNITDATGARMLFLPMQPPGDVDLARSVAEPLGNKALVIQRQVSPAEAVGIVARLDVLLGMRLHPLIFAASVGVPVVGLAYDPKVTQLMELAGQSSRCIPLERMSSEGVVTAVSTALSEGDALRERLRQRSTDLRERALQNVDHALLAIGRSV